MTSLWKILSIIFIAFSVVGPFSAEARKRSNQSFTDADITESPKYASLIVNSSTGEVLHKHNADARRHPASLTKMMTAYLTFQAIKNKKLTFNTVLPVSSWAALPSRSPIKLWLKAGQKISVRDALDANNILSANDASVVLAEAISGSEDAFAYKMTKTAAKLGMKDTVFVNSHGLHDADQMTTAFDMAKLAIALRRDFPEFYPIFSKKSFVYKGTIINGHNRVLTRYPWADGLKTGYVAASGFNLVTSASRPEGKIVAVVLGGASASMRDNHMISLLDRGFYKLANNKTGFDRPASVSNQDSKQAFAANAFEVASIDAIKHNANDTLSNKSAFDVIPITVISNKKVAIIKAKSPQVKLASKSNKHHGATVSKPYSKKHTKSLTYGKMSKRLIQDSNAKKSTSNRAGVAMNAVKSQKVKRRNNITI